jgi:hypothetical protein
MQKQAVLCSKSISWKCQQFFESLDALQFSTKNYMMLASGAGARSNHECLVQNITLERGRLLQLRHLLQLRQEAV